MIAIGGEPTISSGYDDFKYYQPPLFSEEDEKDFAASATEIEICNIYSFGWDTGFFQPDKKTLEDRRKAFYINKYRILGPRSKYCYHGTSDKYYSSIQQDGLDNGKG